MDNKQEPCTIKTEESDSIADRIIERYKKFNSVVKPMTLIKENYNVVQVEFYQENGHHGSRYEKITVFYNDEFHNEYEFKAVLR